MMTVTGRRSTVDGRLLVMLLLLGGCLPAQEEGRGVAWDGLGLRADQAVSQLAALTDPGLHLDGDLLGGAPPRVVLALRRADAVTARSALAVALGAWWTSDPAGGHAITRSRRLPQGPLRARSFTTGLRQRADLEAPVRSLLDPWLGGDAGLSYLPAEGQWSVTADGDGLAQAGRLLTLLEYLQPGAPALVPADGTPGPSATLVRAVGGADWSALVLSLAQATQRSVACFPALTVSDLRPVTLPAGLPLTALPASLNAAGIPAAWHGDLLALGRGEGAEHPAQRRLLCILPAPHLVPDQASGELLVEQLRRRVSPSAWTLPGFGLLLLPEQRSLLCAGDVQLIHQVLEAMDRIDRFGAERFAELSADLGDR